MHAIKQENFNYPDSLEKLEEIVNFSIVPSIIFNPKLEIIHCNTLFDQVFNASIGKNILDISFSFQETGLSSDTEIEFIVDGLEEGQATQAEWTWQKNKNKTFHSLCSFQQYDLAEGSLYICYLYDINKFRNNYNKLEQSNYFFNESLENLPGLFYVINESKEFIHTNKFFREFIGVEKGQLEQKSIDLVLSPSKSEGDSWDFNDRTVKLKEETYDSPNGDLIFKVYRYPFFNQDGNVYAEGYIALDMTKERQLEKELEKERAQGINKSKLASLGEMAAGIGHEINNPLTIISSSCSILAKLLDKDEINIEKIKTLIKQVDSTAIRISKIVKGLRNMSRDSSKEMMEESPVHEIFDDVLSIFAERVKANGIDLQILVDDNIMKQSIYCMRIQLCQVLTNLIANSFDAILELEIEDKWLSIDLKLENDNAVFILTDSGPGIPMDIQEKIFNPFFSTKEIGKGTGLGLSISSTIIKNHDGKLEIDNNCPNTRFIITLPQKRYS